MSKKTNAAKRKAAKKPARKRITRRGRPNPLKGEAAAPRGVRLFSDPVFLHHFAGAILRLIELYPPTKPVPPFSPADFVKPEELAGTGNDGSPEAQPGTELKE